MSNNTVQITGETLYDYLRTRFGMTEEEAIASMKEHKQDLSWYNKKENNND